MKLFLNFSKYFLNKCNPPIKTLPFPAMTSLLVKLLLFKSAY